MRCHRLLLPGEETLTRVPVQGGGLLAPIITWEWVSLRCRVLTGSLGPPWGRPSRTAVLTATDLEQQELLPRWGKGSGRCGSQRALPEAADRPSSVQHGVQLVSQGVKHGADVIQNVLGGGAGGAAAGGSPGSGQPETRLRQPSARGSRRGPGRCQALSVNLNSQPPESVGTTVPYT